MEIQIIEKIVTTSVGFIVTGVLGYCVSRIKVYKQVLNKKDKDFDIIKNSLLTMLQSNLTNTYFVYEKQETIPDYVYKNWLNELKQYENLGGDDYVHNLAKKMETWKITRSGMLN